MDEKKHVKVQGLRFARSLQMLVKMVNIFSAQHKSASGMLQRSYDLLNPLVKQMRHLTVGFVDQRVLLNNILTADEGLKPLENEFLKRGIGAVTFEAGITLAAYRNAVSAIAANPKEIEESGGLLPFLEQKQLEFIRVFPATKSEVRNQDGDTVLDMSSEEYLISKALSNMNSGLPRGIETILTQMEAASTGEPGGNDGGTGSGGWGAGNGEGNGNGGPGTGSGNGTGTAGSGNGNANVGAVVAYHGAGNSLSDHGGYLQEMQKMVEQKFEASLNNPDEDPHKAYVELAKTLRTLQPDAVLSNLSSKPGEGVNTEQATTEVFEDTALRWALRRLASTPEGEEAVIVEEQVFRVLMRSLQATHSAARLAQKLAQFAQEYALPKETYARIQEEIRWITLTPKQKLCELLAITHYTPAQFRRCQELVKELIRLGRTDDAVALGVQYFSIFGDGATPEINEIGRIPELFRNLAGAQGEFWEFAGGHLIKALESRQLNQLIHVQVVNALVTLARIAATYEDFAMMQKVGNALEASVAQDPKSHEKCCLTATSNLVEPSAADRIAEIFLDKRHDAAWVRTVGGVLRWAGQTTMERLFVALDQEQSAPNRLALMRLITRVGAPALPAARMRLESKEWYVVRNACKLLGELNDPELLQYMPAVFHHADQRVQKVALHAVIECELPGRAAVIANALLLLSGELVEHALCELVHQANSESLPGLETFFNFAAERNDQVLPQVINVIAAIPQDRAGDLLARIANNQEITIPLREAARKALSVRATQRVDKFMERPSQQAAKTESKELKIDSVEQLMRHLSRA